MDTHTHTLHSYNSAILLQTISSRILECFPHTRMCYAEVSYVGGSVKHSNIRIQIVQNIIPEWFGASCFHGSDSDLRSILEQANECS